MFRTLLPLALAAGTAITGGQQSRAALSDVERFDYCIMNKVSEAFAATGEGERFFSNVRERRAHIIYVKWQYLHVTSVMGELQPDGTIKIIGAEGDEPQKGKVSAIIQGCALEKKHSKPEPKP